jgi:tetratricopeptide (TPR) repeat protein
MKKGLLLITLALVFAGMAFNGWSQSAPAGPADSTMQTADIVKKADSLLVRKMYEEAIVEYRRALALTPNEPMLLNKMGIAYQQAQNFSQSRKAYEKATKLNPKYSEAWNNLGTVFYSTKNYKKSIKFYKKALGLNPQFATALHNMGAAYFSLNKFEEGFKAIQEAYRLDPSILERTSSHGTVVKTTGGNQAMQNYYMAKLFAANGDLDKAFAYLQKAQESGFKDFEKLEKEPVFEKLIQDTRYAPLKAAKPVEL